MVGNILVDLDDAAGWLAGRWPVSHAITLKLRQDSNQDFPTDAGYPLQSDFYFFTQ
jgi:hypothetical protein